MRRYIFSLRVALEYELSAKGKMDKLRLENMRLQQEVKALREQVAETNEALRESTKLLLKSKPTRPAIPHERKLLQAASQKWRCANPFGTCLLHRYSDGLFDESLFECDHVEPFCRSFRSVGNLSCLCVYCHSLKSRMERLQALEDEARGQGEAGHTDG